MQELTIIARDLETYNKNRSFNERARSMLLPGQSQGAAERERYNRSLEPPSAQLKVGQEIDISQNSLSINNPMEELKQYEERLMSGLAAPKFHN